MESEDWSEVLMVEKLDDVDRAAAEQQQQQ
jgi:hypothetical protein